jgi:hypothetical protein
MYEWAEQECRLACKKENPNFDFDSNDFDYGCSCYKSALKAYKSLCEDNHSGASFNFTRRILERLMRSQPLTPITDEDFKGEGSICSDEDLISMGLKSEIQCPRMSSLFRRETLDGKVSYNDINRAYCIDIENQSDTFSSATDRVVDEFFPITMPYMPENGKYKVYCQTFLTDVKNGDFDTRGILYFITPDGKRIDVCRYQTEKDGKMVNITKEEYEALLEKRIDKLSKKIASHLIWTLVSNSGTEDEIRTKEAAYKKLPISIQKRYLTGLETLCEFFEDPNNCHYNTFSIHQALCCGDESAYSSVSELTTIAKYLSDIKESMLNF